jgi:K+-sensing histidine kinase KdpD
MVWTNKSRIVLIRILKIIVFAAAIFITTKITLEFGMLSKTSTAAFCFLIIVLFSAFFGDLITAFITSFIAAFCFDFFYLPPTGTLNIGAFEDWISLTAFLLTSVIISHLTSSAAMNKANAAILKKALIKTKEFGERLISIPDEKLTLSVIAKESLDVFSLEYCSIHVYGEGKWRHFTGMSSTDIPQEIEKRLNYFQDHSTDLLEIADEHVSGVTVAQIKKGDLTLALLAVKSKTLPFEVVGTIAYMIGVRISAIMKDGI